MQCVDLSLSSGGRFIQQTLLGARLSPSAAWSLVKAGPGGIEGRGPRLSSWWTRDERVQGVAGPMGSDLSFMLREVGSGRF